MAYIEVEVELEEFPTYELVPEIIYRIKQKDIDDSDLKALKSELNKTESDHISAKSLTDQMKIEHIHKIFHKYSLEEFERALPC